MRTTVIPAQITTVEDKIAGSLNLTQILILMVPVFWTTAVYAFLIPTMHLALYKYVLCAVVLLISLVLSLRIRGIVVFNWLQILLAYRFRTGTYVFNKNDAFMRTVDIIPEAPPVHVRKVKTESRQTTEAKFEVSVDEYARIEDLINEKRLAISYRTNGKGGLNVAFSEIR